MIRGQYRFNHTIQLPSRYPLEDHQMTGISSPVFIGAGVDFSSAIHRYLPSAADSDEVDAADSPVDGFPVTIFGCLSSKSGDAHVTGRMIGQSVRMLIPARRLAGEIRGSINIPARLVRNFGEGIARKGILANLLTGFSSVGSIPLGIGLSPVRMDWPAAAVSVFSPTRQGSFGFCHSRARELRFRATHLHSIPISPRGHFWPHPLQFYQRRRSPRRPIRLLCRRIAPNSAAGRLIRWMGSFCLCVTFKRGKWKQPLNGEFNWDKICILPPALVSTAHRRLRPPGITNYGVRIMKKNLQWKEWNLGETWELKCMRNSAKTTQWRSHWHPMSTGSRSYWRGQGKFHPLDSKSVAFLVDFCNFQRFKGFLFLNEQRETNYSVFVVHKNTDFWFDFAGLLKSVHKKAAGRRFPVAGCRLPAGHLI